MIEEDKDRLWMANLETLEKFFHVQDANNTANSYICNVCLIKMWLGMT